MSKRFFTSDFHLGSTNIIKYENRPFASAGEMVSRIVATVNTACASEDTLIHIGDFLLHGHDGHDGTVDTGLPYSKDDYVRMLNCNVFLLEGNHDCNNASEPDAKSMILDLNQQFRNVYVNHFPSNHKFYHGLVGGEKRIQINLCGHVHHRWLMLYDSEKRVLNYNVGVDVHGMKPVQDVTITDRLASILKLDGMFKSSFCMTSEEFENAVNAYHAQVKNDRKRRHAEKLLKKGITPEEARRRKEEAMRRKGLIT